MRRLAGLGTAGGKVGRGVLRDNRRTVQRMAKVKVASRNRDLQGEGNQNQGHERPRTATAAQQFSQPLKPHLHPVRLHAQSFMLQPGCGQIMPTIP